jgi:hypothetical protein
MAPFFRFHKSYGASLAPIVLALAVMLSARVAADNSSLGVIASSGTLLINGRPASTGTTLFSGDTVESRDGSALLRFHDGNRVELVGAKAALARDGQTLIIRPHTGLMRFNFTERGDTRIFAGRFQMIVSNEELPAVGGLAVNQNGQLAVTMCSGRLKATDETEEHEITREKSLLVLRQTGTGSLRRGEDSLLDGTKSWRSGELKGKAIRVGDEMHEILWNNENSLTIDGTWEKPTGWYGYEIRESSGAPLLPQVPINCLTPQSLDIISPAAAAATGAGIGTAVGFYSTSKSESSRTNSTPPED